MARHVRPLGELGAGRAFRESGTRVNLEVFQQALSQCAGRNIVFLFSTGRRSSLRDALMPLYSLLCASHSFRTGKFPIEVIDTIFSHSICGHFKQLPRLIEDDEVEEVVVAEEQQEVIV